MIGTKPIFKASLILIIFILVFSSLIIISIKLLAIENSKNLLEATSFAISEKIKLEYLSKISLANRWLAQNEEVVEVLLNRTKQDNKILFSILQTIKESNNASIVYIINSNGDVVSSSSYGENKSLTGKNYAFRPYFKNAIKGDNYVYAAVGVTSLQRGLYFSAPVYYKGKIIGVSVIKDGLSAVDKILQKIDYGAFITTKEGIIFATNEDNLYKSISKLSEQRIAEIKESNQFADREITNMNWKFKKEKIIVDNKQLLFFRNNFADANLDIIVHTKKETGYVISPLQRTILVTFSLIGLFLMILSYFIVLLYYKNKEYDRNLKKAHNQLEKKVEERTKQLKLKNEDLEKFNKFAIGRELKMVELKKKINELEFKLKRKK